MRFNGKPFLTRVLAPSAAALLAAALFFLSPLARLTNLAFASFAADSAHSTASERSARAPKESLSAQSVQLSASEIQSFKVEPVAERVFTEQREAIGNIAFNDEMSAQVFPPNQGKIIALFAKAGDDVHKGAPLFSVDSPDLAQAEASLISSAGALVLTNRVLERARQLHAVQGLAQKDLDQATSDQQAAEGAQRAARDAVRILGKTDAEMDRIVAERKVDSVLLVRSPITGRVTARNAAPGQLVQPGTSPAPFAISDISKLWMLANVAETDSPLLRLGQEVDVAVKAYPGRLFRAGITNIAAAVDPNTHRVLVRSEIRDPKHELRPGMFATFIIRTGKAARSPAVPYAGMVREGDGTMTVWVTADRKLLTKRSVGLGLQQDGYYQILEGLKPGEFVATEGAIFLNNALTEASR